MIRFAADEDLDNHILRGLRNRLPTIDIVRAQDAALSGASDHEILAWAAEANRVLLSHDASTMTAAAYARVASTGHMPGVIIIPQWLPIGPTIEELLLVAECSEPDDWLGRVRFLPLA